jgi:hypothetical protein
MNPKKEALIKAGKIPGYPSGTKVDKKKQEVNQNQIITKLSGAGKKKMKFNY